MKTTDLLKFQTISGATEGGGGGVATLRVEAVLDEATMEATLDKTWNEIKTAITEGAGAYIYSEQSYGEVVDIIVFTIAEVYAEGGIYEINANAIGIEQGHFSTDDPDGYPSATAPDPDPDLGPIS